MNIDGKVTLWLIWVAIIIILGINSINMYLNLNKTETTINETKIIHEIDKTYSQREEINNDIKEKINKGQIDQIMQIYKGIVGDYVLAHLIISFSLIYDIPTNLLFSIINIESSFNPETINKNKNGTYDYGLMALNSEAFKKYTKEQLFDVKNNLKLGSEHLCKLKQKYDNWGLAVIHYNGLYSGGAGVYLIKVLDIERKYDKIFNEQLFPPNQ